MFEMFLEAFLTFHRNKLYSRVIANVSCFFMSKDYLPDAGIPFANCSANGSKREHGRRNLSNSADELDKRNITVSQPWFAFLENRMSY